MSNADSGEETPPSRPKDEEQAPARTPEEDPPLRLMVRGSVDMERFRRVLEKAGGQYTLQVAVSPSNGGRNAAVETTDRDESEGG